MKKSEKKTVALLFGGRGFEHDVSVAGAKFVFSLIDKEKFEPLAVFIEKDGAWKLWNSPTDEGSALTVHPAYNGLCGGLLSERGFIPLYSAFPLLHGDFGEDGIVQGALENAKIPLVGCDTSASALARDKSVVKTLARASGIPTADWVTAVRGSRDLSIEKARALAESRFGYPMFIKPARLGSSVGAALARNGDELEHAAAEAARVGSGRIIIEEYIPIDRELECAYFAAKGKELFTNLGEIRCGVGFYDYDTKYLSGGADVISRTGLDDELVYRVQEYSATLKELIGLRDLSRIDFFLSRDGRLLFNEINTLPGFTESSLYPRLVAESGIAAGELVSLLLENAGKRGPR